MRRPVLVVAAALAVSAVSVQELSGEPAAASPASVAAAQDTSRARPKRDEERGRRRRVRRGEARGALSDTLAADSLAPPGEPFPEPDSIMRALMQRSGYRPVLYRGDTLHFSTGDRSIHIRERATIERAGDKLYADSVVYRGDDRLVTAYGRSKLINAQGDEVDSEKGPFFYFPDRSIGTVVGGRTQWDIWHVTGNFTLEGNDTLWVKRGVFTSCDLPEPHYHFAADKVKLILGHIVVAWPVRLYFGDVPVFWFPFMAQDIRPGRHSGILTPRFGVNDIVRNSPGRRRHISNVGYYWAISDFMDAQIALDWWRSTWTRIDGFFRYRWRQKFLDGRFGYSQFFLPDGRQETSLTWNHRQKFGERSDLRASVQFVSSQTFQRENEFNPRRLVQQIRSDIGFTRRFDWGTLNLSGQRIQPLTAEGQTTLNLPQASVTFTPLVLFRARSPMQARWYNGLTWTGSANFDRQEMDSPDQPDRTTTTGGLTSGWALGNFRWSSSGSFREQVTDKPDTLFAAPDTSIVGADTTITVDTMVIGPDIRDGTINWRTSFGYQQHLIGSTTLTPAVDLNGMLFRSNETGRNYVSGPTRVSMNATLNSDLFGFFPGVGPAQRIRHKFSPNIRWTYSPEVKPSPEFQALRGFSSTTIRERHQISFSLSQTFEAKLKPRKEPEGPDGAESDTTAPRKPPESRKIMLMAVRSTALTYDFVEGELITDRISNLVTSDLLRGLTIRVEHDLFEEKPDGGRNFAPFLSALNLNFAIGDRTFAGISRRRGAGIERERGILPRGGEMEELETPGLAEEAAARDRRVRGPRRPWNLTVDYSLVRIRPPSDGSEPPPNRQSVLGNLGFSPTENWTISWRTQFDLEKGEFVDQVISLRRDLHRWSATFDFLKAANRNFLFEFRVNLNDLPDLKFDYRQETRRAQVP